MNSTEKLLKDKIITEESNFFFKIFFTLFKKIKKDVLIKNFKKENDKKIFSNL
jgi:hypothetical protein